MNRRDFLKSSALATAAACASEAAPAPPPATTPVPQKLPDLAPAQWIWYPSTRCLPNTFILFRRALNLRAKPRRAVGWIVADSRYRLEVNGRRIQWGPAPCDPRYAEADPVDLTDVLQVGENALGATVLFYGHGDGTWPAGKPGFLFWLDVEHADGSRERIVSDPAWQVMLCRAWRPGQYKRWFLRSLQEDFDARLYPHGWTEAGFKPSADWLPAMPLGGSPNQPALLTKFVEYASNVRTGPADCELRARSIPMLAETLVPVAKLAESLYVKWVRPAEDYFDCHTPGAFEAERKACGVAAGAGEWRVACVDGRAER